MLCAMNDARMEKVERLLTVAFSILTLLAFILLPARH
jgi:hypothetical protein